MLKGLLGIAATGVVAVVAWKLMALILLPILGIAIGVAALVLKLLFVLMAVSIAYWIYRRTSQADSRA